MKTRSFLIIYLILFIGTSLCFAQSHVSQVETEEVRALFMSQFIDDVAGQKAGYTDSNKGADFELVFDVKNQVVLDEKDRTIPELLTLTDLMQTDRYKYYLKNQTILPVSTANRQLVESLNELDNETLQKFLDNKSFFLKKLAKTFAVLGMSNEKVNHILEFINDQFFQKPKVVAEGSFVITPSLFGALGVGFNDKFIDYLSQHTMLKNLPKNAGFYLALSLGTSIILTRKDNGKLNWKLQLANLDMRLGKEFYSPFTIIAGGLSWMVSIENRSTSNLTYIKAKFVKASVPTVLFGDEIVGISVPTGANFIPGGGMAAGIKGDFHRISLTAETIPLFYKSARNFLSRAAKSCLTTIKGK